MSECIVTCDEETASWIGNDVDSMKLLVRCRDCKHYDRMNDDEGMCMVPDDDGVFARWMVDTEGYCYLGERKVDE